MKKEKESSSEKLRKAYNPLYIAKDLGYPEEVVKQIRQAKSEEEITRIMITARHAQKGG